MKQNKVYAAEKPTAGFFAFVAGSMIILLLLIGIIIGRAEAFAETPGNAENGKVLYKKTCIGCHRSKGEGMPPMIPSFREGRAKQMTDEQLFQKISKGVSGTGMPPYADTYSAEQIRDITSYIRELQK